MKYMWYETDEEREAYKQKAAQTPPTGLYVSEKSQINTSIVDTEAEFEEWEKSLDSDAKMTGVFLPQSQPEQEKRDIRD